MVARWAAATSADEERERESAAPSPWLLTVCDMVEKRKEKRVCVIMCVCEGKGAHRCARMPVSASVDGGMGGEEKETWVALSFP